ncbi:MAG: class I SAM-dependent methyltransferase [Planctomycetota bacterium]
MEPVAGKAEFWLDVAMQIECPAPPEGVVRWQELLHCRERRRFFILLAGEAMRVVGIQPSTTHWLELAFMPGLPEISADGLTVTVSVTPTDHGQDGTSNVAAVELLAVPVAAAEGFDVPRTYRVNLGAWAGELVDVCVMVGAGPQGDPSADWLAIERLTIASEEQLSLVSARSGFAWRAENEMAHFSQVYSHAIYSPADDAAAALAQEPEWLDADTWQCDAAGPDSGRDAWRHALEELAPVAGESANAYGHRALGHLIGVPPPDFSQRLRAKAGHRPLRVLSLCSGAARIEAMFLAAVDTPVELTLVDMNRELLLEAASRMPPHVRTRLLLGDANRLPYMPAEFDIAMCVSGLHHLIELEASLQTVAHSLRAGGEFWSVGEQVGRNGNRLWPRDYAVADRLFRSLPEGLRHNRNTQVCDAALPNLDCSSGCFEGIRSEELMGILDRYFVRDDVYLRNCFLWRFVDLAYVDNYDLSEAGDLAQLRSIVVAEFEHTRLHGGVPSELHGVFVKR